MQRRIGARLREIIEAKQLNITEFSRLVDVPYRTLQDYLHDKRSPGLDALACIGTKAGVNLNWLVTGEGPLWLHQDNRPSPSPGASSRPGPGQNMLESTKARETERVAQEIGLGEIALVARRGSQRSAWRILETLSASSPAGLTGDELKATLEQPGKEWNVDDFASGLLLLLRSGLLDATGEAPAQRFRLSNPLWELRTGDFAANAELVMTAIRELSRTLVPSPGMTRLRSFVGLVTARLPGGRGIELLNQLKRDAQETWNVESTPDGPEQTTLILAGWAGRKTD